MLSLKEIGLKCQKKYYYHYYLYNVWTSKNHVHFRSRQPVAHGQAVVREKILMGRKKKLHVFFIFY